MVAVLVMAGVAMTGFVLAQGAPAPQAPAGQPAQPGAGRGGGAGQAGPAPQGRGNAPGARRGGFPQFTRELPSQDVIIRGKALYDTNCASCHAADLRGTPPSGTNLLRSGVAFRDQNGELIGPSLRQHKAPITFQEADVVAVAAYLHSMQAAMGGQGSPPGRNPTNVELNLLVGDAKAGEAKFATYCSKCHQVTGDLRGAATKYGDVRALQNAWVAGSGGRFGGGGRGGGGGAGNPATVTMANGTKLEGTLVRVDDFLVVITLPDGTRRSMARVNGVPRVDVKDPQEAHKKMVLEIDDPANKNMYDITAYLATIK
jgi:cytochrome c oxidase cbb3-type subunit 3